MSSIQPATTETPLLQELERTLWDEAMSSLLDPGGPIRPGRFTAPGNPARGGLDLAAVLPDLCAFLEDSLARFMTLQEAERESWLEQARAGGADTLRFADTLQALRRRRLGCHPAASSAA
jgi:hypothetical protein